MRCRVVKLEPEVFGRLRLNQLRSPDVLYIEEVSGEHCWEPEEIDVHFADGTVVCLQIDYS